MKKIVAMFTVDETKLRLTLEPNEKEDTDISTSGLIEKEMGWLQNSGIYIDGYIENKETYLDAAIYNEILFHLERTGRLKEHKDNVEYIKEQAIDDDIIWEKFFERLDNIIAEM